MHTLSVLCSTYIDHVCVHVNYFSVLNLFTKYGNSHAHVKWHE
jgi:hypothetical protein